MRNPTPISPERIAELEAFRKEKWPGDEFRRYLCVWLRIDSGMKPDEIAKIVGWHTTTVRTTQQEFVKHGIEALTERRRGGRKHALMTPEAETSFLNEFSEQAGAGSLLVINAVHVALEVKLGQKVALSTVYRMLKRNGWRKVVPRPFHPKRNQENAEAFKKKATQKPSVRQKREPRRLGSS